MANPAEKRSINENIQRAIDQLWVVDASLQSIDREMTRARQELRNALDKRVREEQKVRRGK